MDGENRFHCENCSHIHNTKTFTKALVNHSIIEFPKIMIIHCKRFAENQYGSHKISTKIHFDPIINFARFSKNKVLYFFIILFF